MDTEGNNYEALMEAAMEWLQQGEESINFAGQCDNTNALEDNPLPQVNEASNTCGGLPTSNEQSSETRSQQTDAGNHRLSIGQGLDNRVSERLHQTTSTIDPRLLNQGFGPPVTTYESSQLSERGTLYQPDGNVRGAFVMPTHPAEHYRYAGDSNQQGGHSETPVVTYSNNLFGGTGPILTGPAVSSQSAKDSEWISSPAMTGPHAPQLSEQSSRTRRSRGFDSSVYYTPRKDILEPWGSLARGGIPCFRYTRFGELDPGYRLSPAQIEEFIWEHPLRLSQTHTLNLWVQTTPAEATRRYASSGADRCLFNCCPIPQGILHMGSFRVAFSEDGIDEIHAPKTDPYHVAGYVHLNCFERFCNFQKICRGANVRPDTRRFPEGINRMAISRDFHDLIGAVESYLQRARQLGTDHLMNGPPQPYRHRKTLTYRLTRLHISLQSDSRRETRRRRGGNNVEVHMGDLIVYIQGQAEARQNRRKTKREERAREKQRQSAQYEYVGTDEDDEQLTL